MNRWREGLLAAGTALVLGGGLAPAWPHEPPGWGPPDTIRFEIMPEDSALAVESKEDETARFSGEDDWLRVPFGDDLLTDRDRWGARQGGLHHTRLQFDYNRVDRLRLGVGHEIQSQRAMAPRIGARLEYAFGRERTNYGLQLEQPLLPPGRLALGVSIVRRTDHSELQQVEDIENSLALLFGRQDYRDYFEREGRGAYLSWRVPDFSTLSIHVRRDEYRSLPLHRGTRSFFHRGRELRVNPAIDDGVARTLIVRLERLARHGHRTRAGFYHWIDFETARAEWGGDFDYSRLLADLRSVIRLSPATTLALRLVSGHTFAGTLPFQKHFTVGGVDGLRAHAFADDRGDQMILGQAEYTIGLWRLRSGMFEGGLHAIVFTDVGRAWSDPGHGWDLGRQRLQADGGVGLSTSEDNLRVYVAKNLRQPDSDYVVSVRLHRPF